MLCEIFVTVDLRILSIWTGAFLRSMKVLDAMTERWGAVAPSRHELAVKSSKTSYQFLAIVIPGVSAARYPYPKTS